WIGGSRGPVAREIPPIGAGNRMQEVGVLVFAEDGAGAVRDGARDADRRGADLAPNVARNRHKGGARSLGVAVTYRRKPLCCEAAMPYNVVPSSVTPTPSAFT